MNETNQIGQILPTGHKVLANYKNSIILACHQNPEAPEPWVTWHLNGAGERYSGSYFADQESAERYFAYLCFEWADERTCTPQALAPEEDESTEENIKNSSGSSCNCWQRSLRRKAICLKNQQQCSKSPKPSCLIPHLRSIRFETMGLQQTIFPIMRRLLKDRERLSICVS